MIARDIPLAFRYLLKNNIFFTKEMKCYNISTQKEIPMINNSGSNGFCIGRKFVSLTRIKKNLVKLNDIQNYKITTEDVFTAVCNQYNCSTDDLKGKSRQNGLDDARLMLTMILHRFISPNQKVIAELISRKQSRVSELLDIGWSYYNIARAFRNNYNLIEDKLKWN